MSALDKTWHIYIGGSWLGTLTPTTADDQWYIADFTPGDAWGNFAPWFERAFEAFQNGDQPGWDNWYSQLTAMGVDLTAEDGETHHNPTLHIDGQQAWFLI